MKTKNQLLKGLAVILLVIASTIGAKSQTLDTPTQEVCPGTQPYLINPGNAGNTFLWSIGSGVSGTDWTIESPTLAATNIVWGVTTTPQTYTVTFREVDPVTHCYDEKTLQVTVNPQPVAPTGDPITACETDPVQTITAIATAPEGATIVWYDAPTDGSIVADPSLSAVGTVTYYAESQIGTCASPTRTPIVLTINPAPLAPTGDPITACGTDPVQPITAIATAPDGATIVWYDAPTGGNIIADPTLSAVGTITYYAESQLGTCASPTRTPVVLTIFPAPIAPTAEDQTACELSPIQTLTATATVPDGINVVWFDAAIDGNIVAEPTLSSVGSITYYAEAQIGTCISSTRTPVILTIEPAPLPTIGGPDAMCAATESNIYNTEAGMTNYSWIVSAGGTITAGGTTSDNTVTVTWVADGPQTVSVNYENTNGCSADTPAVRNVTVSPIPNTSPIYHN